MQYIPAKTILQKVKHGEEWFGIDYNINLYKGCSHKCIYCDSRSSCYQIENFDEVKAKENEIEILSRELVSKRKKGVIGIGSMSDTYNPFENKYEITKKALELIAHHNFGISIETKSNLITRDIELFKEINSEADVILKLTITTSSNELSRIIEPNVCSTKERFKAMKELSSAGLFVGTLLTPIIPFITDSEDNIKEIIRLSAENGAKFVYSFGGLTLRDNQREYFYSELDKNFPGVKERYISTYGNNYFCKPLNKNLSYIFKEECEKYGLLYKMNDIIKAYKKTDIISEQLTFL